MNKGAVLGFAIALAVAGLSTVMLGAGGAGTAGGSAVMGGMGGRSMADAGLPGISKPSGDVTLSFQVPGRVKEVLVKEGEQVKKGQVVATLDDDVELKALAVEEAKAKDTTQKDAELIIRKQKVKDLERQTEARKNGGTTTFEYENAALEVDIADARIKLAEFQTHVSELEYLRDLNALDRRKIVSEIDGVVVIPLMMKAGEVAESQNSKVMRIVQLDPLFVEVMVPFTQAQQLKKGDQATVTLSDKSTTVRGKVLLRSSVGDPGSQKLLVRLEVANPKHRESGETVWVKFDGPDVAAAKK